MNRSLTTLISILALGACNSSDSPSSKTSTNDGTKLIGGCISNQCGPSNEVFFSNENYAKLKLTFTKNDLAPYGSTPEQWEDLLWSKWKSQCGNYEWLPVNMVYEPGDGSKPWTLNKVGMRMRGSKSRGGNPLGGFKLDYEKLLPPKTDRRFSDMERLDLLSNENDPSMILQCLTYELMRDFGLNSPKCNHVQVYVNEKLYGLMESVEGCKDKRYLERHFTNPDGPLFAVSASNVVCGFPLSQGDLEYKGDTFDGEYLKQFEVLRGEPADAESKLIPMLKCGDEKATPNDEDFKACIKDWIDVEEWLKLIAAESLTPTVEDFVGARRNFFLYAEPSEFAGSNGRIHIWGWDYDTALNRQQCYPGPVVAGGPTCSDPFKIVTSWFGPRGTRPKLVTRLTRVFKDQYCGVMKKFLDDVYLPEKVTRMASVIEPAILADPTVNKQGWNWQGSVDEMHDFMAKHRAEMLDAIGTACPGSSNTGGAAGAAGAAGAGVAEAGSSGAVAGAGGAAN
ncbi:MAG TPA: CotH kinase family protein [Polyangiaceae bacterium]